MLTLALSSSYQEAPSEEEEFQLSPSIENAGGGINSFGASI